MNDKPQNAFCRTRGEFSWEAGGGFTGLALTEGLRHALSAGAAAGRAQRAVHPTLSGGAHNGDNWEAHGDLEKNHRYHAGRTDQPIAALIKDLKQRGALDSTLILWGDEFGRQPTAEYAEGRGRRARPQRLRLHDVGGGGRHQRRREGR